MGSFKRVLLGYRRADVDAAVAARDARVTELEALLPRLGELEAELCGLSAMIIDREREIHDLRQELREAHDRHDRSLASLDSVSQRLDEIQAQARGQATRIRMKALREAVEVSRRVQELAGRIGGETQLDVGETQLDELPDQNGDADLHGEADLIGNGDLNGTPEMNGAPEMDDTPEPGQDPAEFFEGLVKIEIGPLGDFAQLVGFEDAAGQIEAASEISVERFSDRRATVSMRLAEPVELLRELEQRSPLGFRVRHTSDDRLILDVSDDEQGPAQQAA